MQYLIIAAFCLGAAQAFSGAIPPNQQRAPVAGRIVGGWSAAVNQFPWQAIIQLNYTAGGSAFCGGSLLSNQWVLTAAHCTTGVSSYSVRLGSNNINTPTLTVSTSNRTVHPAYNSQTLGNNLALIRLPNPITLTPSIQPIRLPSLSQASATFAGEVAAVSGFGRINDASPSLSTTLQWVNVTVVTNAVCSGVYGTAVVTAQVICARGTQLVTQNSCNGDDGGALVNYQGATRIPVNIGVVSFVSNRGCSAGDPSGYVRTSQYLNWISATTGIPMFP